MSAANRLSGFFGLIAASALGLSACGGGSGDGGGQRDRDSLVDGRRAAHSVPALIRITA